MAKTCKRPYCGEPVKDPSKKGAGLCLLHDFERRQRSNYTKSLPRCLKCSNIPKRDHELCGQCEAEEAYQAEPSVEEQLERLTLHVQMLEYRLQALEEE